MRQGENLSQGELDYNLNPRYLGTGCTTGDPHLLRQPVVCGRSGVLRRRHHFLDAAGPLALQRSARETEQAVREQLQLHRFLSARRTASQHRRAGSAEPRCQLHADAAASDPECRPDAITCRGALSSA